MDKVVLGEEIFRRMAKVRECMSRGNLGYLEGGWELLELCKLKPWRHDGASPRHDKGEWLVREMGFPSVRSAQRLMQVAKRWAPTIMANPKYLLIDQSKLEKIASVGADIEEEWLERALVSSCNQLDNDLKRELKGEVECSHDFITICRKCRVRG